MRTPSVARHRNRKWRIPSVVGELDKTDNWPELMRRMCQDFAQLVASKPACVRGVVQELLKHEDSVTFLDALQEEVAELKETDTQVLVTEMQHHGYYASIQGPWLVCSKAKKQHDTMLFAAQAAQVLAKADMMIVPRTANQNEEPSIAA
jgi:hypothetical protein